MREGSDATERTPCAICHSYDTSDVFAGRTEVPLVSCDKCGLVYQAATRTAQQLDDAQSTAYARPAQRFAGPVERSVRLFRSARARLAERLLRGPGRVLDIGCGRGVFLEILRGRGHAVRGTELSEATAANALPGIPVDPGEVRAGRYAPESFDLISIWHVLEHDQRPDEVLRACHEFLVPGGALMIAVPNFASVQARIGRELWFHLDLPRHIFQFTPTTLKRLLADSGYEIQRCSTGQWEMDPFGLLQTALNRLGLRPNAMYDSLRTNRAVQRDLSPLYRAAMLLLCPLGMLLALPISGVLRIAGRAGTIIAVARKPAA